MSTISYSQLGSWGRLGNGLFQIASMIGLSQKYNKKLLIPKWKYDEFFTLDEERGKLPKEARKAQERGFDYSEDHWDANLKYTTDDVDINGWLQSEKYWEHCKERVFKNFTFNKTFAERTRSKMSHVLDNGKETIAISIRRGDYVGNPNYELLPLTYYALALYEKFPKWQTDYNVIIFTDDFYFAKHHFECFDNVYYAEYEGHEQLYLMSQCKHFIIANSTFSWWGAYLGEGNGGKVIRPNYLFDGDLKKYNSDKDFWPDRWEIFDHKEDGKLKKFDIQDVTFTIPVFYDHKDREENLMLNVLYLNKYFDTEILVGEQGQNYFEGKLPKFVKYHFFDGMKYFHRTKMLNDMSNMTDTPIAVNYDADMFTPPLQIIEGVRKIRSGECAFVYPYDGRFARVNRKQWYRELKRELDTAIFYNNRFHGTAKTDASSTGGAVIYDKESFVYVGMENENMISYGPEDTERWERYHRLGYSVGRIKGVIYHMDHTITMNSSGNHPHHGRNYQELERVRNLTTEQLLYEVGTWKWVNQYLASYYETISQGAINSCREVFSDPLFKHMGIKTILDVGAGIGEWGVPISELGIEYRAVDYKIPKQKLLIPKENYKNFDLRRNKAEFPFSERFDLVLCLEVLEHIDEKYAEEIITFLCSKADRVLFSAAIPCQGGHFHVNEQWQDYWANLFEANGYFPVELPNIRRNRNIEPWYRQNMVLYVNHPTVDRVEKYVLPEMYTNIMGTRTNWKTIKPL